MSLVEITSLDAIERPALAWDTVWQVERGVGEWVLAGPVAGNPMGLAATASIASAIVISLFTDRRAPEGWRPEIQDRRGWWGDAIEAEGEALDPLGSWLWLLENEVVSSNTLALARAYAEAALAWLVSDRVAARVEVVSEIREGSHGINLGVSVFGKTGAAIYAARFDILWQQVR